MKKIILFLVLVVSCFTFVGCGGDKLGEKYWLDTAEQISQLLKSDDYIKVESIEYNDHIKALMANENCPLYIEIESVYDALYNASIYCINDYAKVFLITPNDNKKFKKAIIEVNSEIVEYKEDLSIFIKKLDEYKTYVDYDDESTANSDIEKKRLSDFKVEYINLMESALELSESLLQAYKTGYYNYSDFKNIDATAFAENVAVVQANRRLALHESNIEIVSSTLEMLELFNDKQIDVNYADYTNKTNAFINDLIKVYYDKLDTPIAQDILSDFIVWEGMYKQYKQDAETFEDVLEDLNLDYLRRAENTVNQNTSILQTDKNMAVAIEYAKLTGKTKDQSLVFFYKNYHKNIDILYNYTSNLFN